MAKFPVSVNCFNPNVLPVVFVIKLQLSKISVNTSKKHSYFQEFPDQLGRLCPPHFYSPLLIFRPSAIPFTLESGIDIGQGINEGPGKFAKKNRALNEIRASEN
jgi:hypothetical protein